MDNSALQRATHLWAPVGASVGWVCAGRFAQEAIQLSTGGIQRVLFRFSDARPHQQRSTIVSGELSQGVLAGLFGELVVVVTAANQLAAERPEVVAMPAKVALARRWSSR